MVSQERVKYWVKMALRYLLRLIVSLVIWALALFLLITIANNEWGADETNTITLPAGYTVLTIFLPIVLAGTIWIKPVRAYARNKRARRFAHAPTPLEPAQGRADGSGPIRQSVDSRAVVQVDDVASEKDVLSTIAQMEADFASTYRFTFEHFLNAQDCQRAFSMLCNKWGNDALPIPVQIRFEQLRDEYRDKFQFPNPLLLVDSMNGHDFEHWCAQLLQKNGFGNVEVTPGSGDQGVDVLACKDGVHYAIQCKCYHSDLGNTPVQEVFAGKEFYRCQVGAVMTNRHFTSGAKQLASHTRVLLWDREKLIEMLKIAGEKFPEATEPKPNADLTAKEADALFRAAVEIVLETGQASVSLLQRRLKLGYVRASGLIDRMEDSGIIGPFEGVRPRAILINKRKWDELKNGL